MSSTDELNKEHAITITLNWRLSEKQGLQSKLSCVLCFTMAHLKSLDFVAVLSDAPFRKRLSEQNLNENRSDKNAYKRDHKDCMILHYSGGRKKHKRLSAFQ